MSAAVTNLLARFPDQNVRLYTIRVTQTTPSLKVSIAGSSTDYPAKAMAGSTFSIGTTGYALWASGMPPLCFRVS